MTFTPAALRFLRSLSRHNIKAWFEAHRPEYGREGRGPMRALIEELDVRLARLAPEITGDPRRSMFRIYRDIRFSEDKLPYKTHAACCFYHRDADRRVGSEAEGGGAGFYFQIAPGESFVGGGIWMPARPVLNRIRDAIAQAAGPLAQPRARAPAGRTALAAAPIAATAAGRSRGDSEWSDRPGHPGARAAGRSPLLSAPE